MHRVRRVVFTWACLLWFFAIFTLSSWAADISFTPQITKDIGVILVSGKLEEGDEEKFIAIALGTPQAVVRFNSDGGNLLAGIEIGKAIRLKDFVTEVADGDVCASACALAWLGGTKRVAHPNSRIGFHAAYNAESGEVTGSGNAIVGAYLNQLGLSQAAIAYVTNKSPQDMEWLSAEKAVELGIVLELHDEDREAGVVPPVPLQSLADERVDFFLSDVTVNRDGSLDVRETIVVRSTGREIKHGILRVLPKSFTDESGTLTQVSYDVLGAKRDMKSENYVVEPLSDGVRVRIGDKDVLIEAGRHTYEISYRAIRKFINSKSSDQLYWNVTGDNWSFAINRAIVNVHLPEGAEIQQNQAYSGQGVARENDYNVIQAEGTEYRAVTTRSLDPGEGFTIAVSWKKGTVPAVDLEPGSVVKIHGKLVAIPVPNPRR